MKKITILIPCHNEENGIGKVIGGINKEKLKKLGFHTEIIVIDNKSTDNTSTVAKKLGVKVFSEPRKGKGNAIRTGFSYVSNDTDIVVMLDGDNTYKGSEIPRMIEPIDSGFCDVVVGSRLDGKITGKALSFSHRFVNWCFTFFTRKFYETSMTDTCTGYFAWKKEVADKMSIYSYSDGFAIESEMITKMARLGYKTFSVPITYDSREGESKLSPVIDGLRITWMLIKNIAWKPNQNKLINPNFKIPYITLNADDSN